MASKWLSSKLSLRRHSRHISSNAAENPRHSEFHKVFRRFDSNGDGKISSDELWSFFSWVGADKEEEEEVVTAEEIKNVMSEHDSDGDGLIDFGDFMRLMEMEKGEKEEDLRKAFEMFEAEKGSGFITPDGLRSVFRRLGEARSTDECAAMIGAYDLDGNGVLDYQEFHRMMA